jgi:hypothetical protein
MCIWWASFQGWFDCQCDTGTPAPPAGDYVWTQLDLALFSDDASALYEEFSGKNETGAPTDIAPTQQPTVQPMPVRR